MNPVEFDPTKWSIADLNAMLFSMYHGEHRHHKDYDLIGKLIILREEAYEKEAVFQRQRHLEICTLVGNGVMTVTEEMMASVTNPTWKRELIEAICLRKVGR